MKFKLLGLLLLVVVVGCSVSPHRVLNLNVKNQDGLWLKGKELVKLDSDGLELVVNFDRTIKGTSLFEISIANNTQEAILISPEDIYGIMPRKFNQKETIHALDPEEMIHRLDTKIERVHARDESNKRSDLVFSLFDLADSFSSKTEEERQQDDIDRDNHEKAVARRAESNSRAIKTMSSERSNLATNALRKTTLFPNQRISGSFYMNIPEDVSNIIIHFPFGDRDISLEYENKKM